MHGGTQARILGEQTTLLRGKVQGIGSSYAWPQCLYLYHCSLNLTTLLTGKVRVMGYSYAWLQCLSSFYCPLNLRSERTHRPGPQDSFDIRFPTVYLSQLSSGESEHLDELLDDYLGWDSKSGPWICR